MMIEMQHAKESEFHHHTFIVARSSVPHSAAKNTDMLYNAETSSLYIPKEGILNMREMWH